MKNTGEAGFTLVELFITMSMISILAVIGVVSFRTMIHRGKIGTAAREFVASANLARSEAVRRSMPVTICRSSNGTSHTTSGDWDLGWIVFADADGDATVDAGDEILQVHGAIGGGTKMLGPPNVITYNSRGLPAAGGTIAVRNPTEEAAHPSERARIVSIALSTTGRLTTTMTGN